MSKNKWEGKRKTFLSAECQLTDVEEMMELEKRLFDNHYHCICFRHAHQ